MTEKTGKRGTGKLVDPLEKIARSVDLLLRLKIDEVKGQRSQKEMIHFLSSLGAGGGEIASFLNVNRTTVDPELSKLRASAKGAKKNHTATKRKAKR